MKDFILSDELREAVSVAEITMRPLLLKGEPGTGKTLLANFVAETKNLSFFRWHVKSTSLAKEGLYFYDAVARLNDSRFPGEEAMLKVGNVKNYIRLGALGESFFYPKKSVVLIDEIDKADIEFPKRENMKSIVFAHFPRIETELLEKALAMFYTIRKIENLRKKPSTSELLDWIQVLLHTGENLQSNLIPFAGTLFKSEDDYRVHLN